MRDQGGPAFPATDGMDFTLGMTLRDYFAGQALANPTLMSYEGWEVGNERSAATVAYVIADAMLRERAK